MHIVHFLIIRPTYTVQYSRYLIDHYGIILEVLVPFTYHRTALMTNE